MADHFSGGDLPSATSVGVARLGDPRARHHTDQPSVVDIDGGDDDLTGLRPLLRARCVALARRYLVPGAQFVIARGGARVAVEVGEVEHRGGQPTTAATAFPIGSITKSLTAALAMVLVADGDLELDAPVGEYLPVLAAVGDRAGDGVGDEVTLRHLLSHTAGLQCGPDSAEVATASTRRYLADHCRRRDLVLPPGTGFSYSNAGYVVVGAAIEAVTGMPWPEAIDTLVLRPLALNPPPIMSYGAGGSADHDPRFMIGEGRGRGETATGHSVRLGAGRTRAVRQALAPVEAPIGALELSAMDLATFGRAVGDPACTTLLPASWSELMRRPVPGAEPFGLAEGWGLGLATYRDGGRDWVGHDGNGHGTACYLRVDPDSGWVVAFVSNANTGALMWQDLCDQLRSLGIPAGADIGGTDGGERVAGHPAMPAPRAYAGRYANGGVEFLVSVRDGRAQLCVDDEPPVSMTFRDPLVFWVPDPQTRRQVPGGRFLREPGTDQPYALQIGGRVARRTRVAREIHSPLSA